MKPKTDDKGVRRVVFSASDVRLWRRFCDSLVELEIIQRGQLGAGAAAEMRRAIEAVLRDHTPLGSPEPEAPDDE